jgi:hypothetical protein
MRQFFFATLPVFLLVPTISSTAPPESQPSHAWRPLFDGKSLDGWEHVGPGKMVLEAGVIRTDGGMGLLWYTREQLGNCVIRVVYKTSNKEANSGVFVRIADRPKDEWYAVHHGYEIQICDTADELHGTGAVYSLAKATGRPVKPQGEWNTMDITLRGPRIVVSINGEPVNDFNSETATLPERTHDYEPERGPRPETGYIGLQNHDDTSHVYFKQVSVRPLTHLETPKR